MKNLELLKIFNLIKGKKLIQTKLLTKEEYFSFTRETMSNSSVEHLHIQFLVWKLQWSYLRKMLQSQGFPVEQKLKM